MPNPKPLVAAAFICERVLREQGPKGDIVSAIRIVDTYTTVIQRLGIAEQGEEPASNIPPAQILDATGLLNLTALVILRAGDAIGRHEVSMAVRNPNGKETPFPQTFPVNFALNDKAEGAQFVVQFVMPADAPGGLYWIDVRWDAEALTSIPLKLVKEPPPAGIE